MTPLELHTIDHVVVRRPEMLQPMGLPEDVSVMAWGLALERPTMILYNFNNIRDLFGHGVDLNMIGENAMVNLANLSKK